jgi:Putative phage serine protease XkdF
MNRRRTTALLALRKHDLNVGQPAVAARLHAAANPNVAISKVDEELQIVYGEVYAPGFPDSQGDYMSRETIREMAFEFMRKGLGANIDIRHSQEHSGAFVVESFLARDDDSIFIPGSWVIGVKVPDPVLWAQIKSGELNGFSLDGKAMRVDSVLEIDMPDYLRGKTEATAGHSHTFHVRYDDQGNFLGGMTGPGPDGHVHKILRGTTTEDTDGHAHRFSFVEGVLHAQAAA